MTDYGNNLCAADPPHLFGGWSQYMYIVPGSFLVRVPDDLPSEVAVLTEIMAVAVGLDRAKQMSAFPRTPSSSTTPLWCWASARSACAS